MSQSCHPGAWNLVLAVVIALPVCAEAGMNAVGNCNPPNVQVRGTVYIKNNTGQAADDLHFYMYQNDRPEVMVTGAKAESNFCTNINLTTMNDDGTANPPPGDHGAQVDMTGCSIPAGATVPISISLCMNERNCIKFKDIMFTQNAVPLPNPRPLPKKGFRIIRPFRGGRGGGLPGGGSQEDNGGSGNWYHIVCIENDDTRWLVLDSLKLLASMTNYPTLDSINWAALPPVTSANGEPPVCIPPGGKWCYRFETTGSYVGGHVYLKYSIRVANPGECPGSVIAEGPVPLNGEPDDSIETIGDHPVDATLSECRPGDDMYTVPALPDGTYTNFGTPESPPIPADFFGPGSDPFIGRVDYVGVPIDPATLGNTDTIVRRTSELDFDDLPPSTASVNIELVECHLQSTDPIIVTYNGGTNPTPWDVHVDIVPGTSSGFLDATREADNGGTFSGSLGILPVFTFTQVDSPSNVIVFDPGSIGIPPIPMGSVLPTPWSYGPSPGSVVGQGPNFYPKPQVPHAFQDLSGGTRLTLLPATFAHGDPSTCRCTVSDNGSGTADLPPACPGGYASPAGIPLMQSELMTPGTGIVGRMSLVDLTTLIEQPGGSLGGTVQQFQGTMRLQLRGTGDLAGYEREMFVQVGGQTHAGPRTPGDAVQDFDTDMFQLQGQLFGDPDFVQVGIQAGSAFGLPSPGHTTLTRLPSGDYTVDSFFDIAYRIDFIGTPTGPLNGAAGTTQGQTSIQATRPVEPGIDAWRTIEETVVDFGLDQPPIPADFFYPGSEPFFGEVRFTGAPTDPILGNADTIVQRLVPAELPFPGDTDTVPIELVELHLQSLAPIAVNGEPWDVQLDVWPSLPGNGQMTITRTHPEGGVFQADFFVQPVFTFTRVSNGDTVTLPNANPMAMNNTPVPHPWQCAAPPEAVPGTGPNFFPLPGLPMEAPHSTGTPHTLIPAAGPLLLTGAASRLTHGAAGAFDQALPLSGTPGIEPRFGGPNGMTVLMELNSPPAEAAVDCSLFNVDNAACVSAAREGNRLKVRLGGVNPDGCVRVGMPQLGGLPLIFDQDVEVAVLLGDRTGDGVVNIVDLNAVKQDLFQVLSPTNFVSDVNADGVVNIVDLNVTKQNLFSTADACP